MRVSYLAILPGLAMLVFATGPAFLLGVVWTGLALNTPFSLHVTLGQDYLPTPGRHRERRHPRPGRQRRRRRRAVFGALADATSLQTSLATMLVIPLVAAGFTTGLRDPLLTRSPAR